MPVDVESYRQYAQRVLADGIKDDPRMLACDILVMCDALERERAGNAELRRDLLEIGRLLAFQAARDHDVAFEIASKYKEPHA